MDFSSFNKSLKASLLCGVALSGFTSTNAMAQDVPVNVTQGQYDTIRVTARKKDETSIEVPMNITAVGSAELEARNLVDTSDLFRTVAGAAFPRTELILRGLSGGNDSTPNTTSTFVDGVEFRFSDLFDVERVEVLRGPQGTLWGSNAIGGTVQIITKAPRMNEFQVEGSMQATQEKNGHGLGTRANLAINIPLVEDKLAMRITGMSAYEPNKLLNTYTGLHGYDKDQYLRAQLLFNATDDLTVKLGFIHTQEYQSGYKYADRSTPDGYWLMNLTEDATEPYGWAVSDTFIDCAAGQERSACRQSAPTGNGDYDPKFAYWEIMDEWEERETNMGTLNVDYADIGGFASMSYVGSYRSTGDKGLDNWSRRDANDIFRSWIINHNFYPDAGKRHTHELRFNSINEDSPIGWTVGAFYDKQDRGNVPDRQFQYHQGDDGGRTYAMANYWWGDDAAQIGQDLYGDPNKNYNINQVDNWYKEFALFGEASYTADLGDAGEVELTGGLRYFEISDYDHTIESGIWIGPVANDAVLSGKETGTRKKFSASWRPDENLSVYALYSEGYRPGGNNFPSLPHSCAADPNAQFYKPRYTSDQIKNYEVGTKGAILDRKITFSTAVYQIDWTDVQSDIYMDTCGFSFYGNAITARSQGIEIETNSYLTDTLLVTANFSYTKSKITADAPSINASAGDDMTMVPKYNAYVALQQNFDVYDRPAFIRGAVSVYGESKSHFQVRPEDISPGYATVDLAASIDATDNVRVSLHVNNLFNKDYTTYRNARSRSLTNTSAAKYFYYGRERTITLRGDFSF